MRRRELIATGLATLAAPPSAMHKLPGPLRFMPQADLALLDSIQSKRVAETGTTVAGVTALAPWKPPLSSHQGTIICPEAA